MRISDWSSDVCSSDLPARPRHALGKIGLPSGITVGLIMRVAVAFVISHLLHQLRRRIAKMKRHRLGAAALDECLGLIPGRIGGVRLGGQSEVSHRLGQRRSEEHTSELQSLMRISYAVFCLK